MNTKIEHALKNLAREILETENISDRLNYFKEKAMAIYEKLSIIDFLEKELKKARNLETNVKKEYSPTEENEKTENRNKFNEILADLPKTPIFVKKEENDDPLFEIPEIVPQKTLNDTLKKDFHISLNDRLAFTRALFDGNGEILNKVIIKIGEFKKWEEAYNYIVTIIKPNFGDWKGREDVEARFLNWAEQNFEN